jgi:hypothetical protein
MSEFCFSRVIPDGSLREASGEPLRDPCLPACENGARQGYIGPGSRALRRSAGMTTEKLASAAMLRRFR